MKEKVSHDINKVIHYLSLAAGNDSSISQFYFSCIYSEGKYITQDLTLASNQNFPNAQYILWYLKKSVLNNVFFKE